MQQVMQQVMRPNHAVRHHPPGDYQSEWPEAYQRRAFEWLGSACNTQFSRNGLGANEMVLGQSSFRLLCLFFPAALYVKLSRSCSLPSGLVGEGRWVQPQYRFTTYSQTLLAFELLVSLSLSSTAPLAAADAVR